jgi:hypothetical protein
MAKKEKPQVREIEDILSNPSDKAKLQGFIDEAARCKQLIADQNESIKGIREVAVEEIGINPKLFNSLVKVSFDGSSMETKATINSLDTAIAILFGTEE